MTITKWKLADGQAWNAEAEKMLRVEMHHHAADHRRRWRGVRRAAAALLAFAYDPLTNERRALRQLNEIMAYHARGAFPPTDSTTRPLALSPRTLRQIQREIRHALSRLVLSYYPNEPSIVMAKAWKPPEGRVRLVYGRADVRLIAFVHVDPPWVGAVFAAAAILQEAMSWLRVCALCGRLFLKIKTQTFCVSRCQLVRAARNRRGRKDPHRGRKRTDFAAAVEAEHRAWLADA